MLKIERTTDLNLVKEVMTNKALFEASMPDEDIAALKEGQWNPSPYGWTYLKLEKDNKIIGILRYMHLSNITVDLHWHLLPEYWGSGLSDKFQEELEKWFRKNTKVFKITVQTPSACKHTIKAAARVGYEIEGMLIGAIVWRDKVEHLVLMSKFLRDF
jgi:RimJ/RimL family protein N-acetyltransferase